jgi:integrase/recombinase XerD
MLDHLPEHGALLAQLKEHFAKQAYCLKGARRYLVVADSFLRYLKKRHVVIDAAEPSHVSGFLGCELRRYAQRHGHPPCCIGRWRTSQASGVHHLLRLSRGQWPPSTPACDPYEAFTRSLCREYAQWLHEWRGLASETICDLAAEARRFLSWYGQRTSDDSLLAMSVVDIDAYLLARVPSLRRISRKDVSQRLRSFFRFLHATGRTPRDFAPTMMAPTLYALESIPSALRPEDISAVLQTARKDRSPKGLRDYAILLFLSTYGLRAGEITRLRLNDIDWRGDRFCVHHTKTGSQTVLPLLPVVGEALLAYLRQGRPATDAREIFIRARAPYRGFGSGSSLYSPTRRWLEAAGVRLDGKRGPHTFRHARAVSLLRSAVPLKIIGDVLGHRSAASTAPYLKLSTEELRDVALEIPGFARGDL